MRRTLSALAALGILVAAGCGDDDGGDGTAEGGGGSTEEFCAGFIAVNEEFADVDPTTDADAYDDAVEALRELDPPEEIVDDYATVIDGFEALADIDPTDPEAGDQIAEQVPGAEEAFTALDDFLSRECGEPSE
jgi:hypothetical protein